MHQRERIPTGIFQKYKDTVYFLVDIDCRIILAVEPQTFWVLVMAYEIGVDIAKIYAKMLLSKPVDRKAKRFETYEEASSKIKKELKEPIIQKKVRKMIDILDKKYEGEAFGTTASTGTSEQTGAKSRKNEEQIDERRKCPREDPRVLHPANRQHI